MEVWVGQQWGAGWGRVVLSWVLFPSIATVAVLALLLLLCWLCCWLCCCCAGFAVAVLWLTFPPIFGLLTFHATENSTVPWVESGLLNSFRLFVCSVSIVTWSGVGQCVKEGWGRVKWGRV